MPFNNLNAHIAETWQLLAKQIYFMVEDQLAQGLGFSGVTFTPIPGTLDVRLNAAPAVNRLDVGGVHLFLPAAGNTWGLTYAGTVSGSILGSVPITPRRVVFELADFSLEVDVTLDSATPVPSTTGATFTIEFRLSIGDEIRLATASRARPGDKEVPNNQLLIHVDVTINLLKLFGVGPESASVGIDIDLTTGKIGLSALGKDLAMAVPGLQPVRVLLELINSKGLPALYPPSAAPIPPAPPPVVHVTSLDIEVARVENSIASHLQNGLVADRSYPPRYITRGQVRLDDHLRAALKGTGAPGTATLARQIVAALPSAASIAFRAWPSGTPVPDDVIQGLNSVIATAPPLDMSGVPPDNLPFISQLFKDAATLKSSDLQARANRFVIDASFPNVLSGSQAVSAACGTQLYGERDSAIWSGHLLAAEAFRYAATTGSAQTDAANRLREVLHGLELLFAVPAAQVTNTCNSDFCRNNLPLDVHVTRGLFCRSVLPDNQLDLTFPRFNDNPDIELAGQQNTFYDTGAPVAGEAGLWYGFSRGVDPPTRDPIAGIVLGLACAHKYAAGLDGVDERVKVLAKAFADRMIVDRFNLITPAGELNRPADRCPGFLKTTFTIELDQRLAILRLAASAAPDDVTGTGQTFAEAYADHSAAYAEFAWFPNWINLLEPVAGYFKFNLSHAALCTLLLLENDATLISSYQKALKMVRANLKAHGNAYFNMVAVLGGIEPVTAVEADVETLLTQLAERHHLVPGPNALPLNKTPSSSLTYRQGLQQGNFLKDRIPLLAGPAGPAHISLFALPPHARIGDGQDFMWQRPPFDAAIDSKGNPVPDGDGQFIESPGVDLLLPFWMLRLAQKVATDGP